MHIGKWILGGLGFVLGGPIGAVVGVVLASFLEDGSRVLPEAEQEFRQTTHQNNTRTHRPSQGDIHISILVLIACTMKADGHVRKSELDAVKRFLVRTYGKQQALEALQVLKQLLEQTINPDAVARQIAQNVNYSTRLEILHFLLDLAHTDGEYAPTEQQLIAQIAVALGIRPTDFRSLSALYEKDKNPDWAYQALEIQPSATNDEVKKAYRRMAMKYHPDKVASAGEDIRQKATEKFRAINEAYEYIKQQRGIK
ncbi:MAG: TerB family tellurite resistance protein [Paludibacter sp.]|nr:TerB family tellurite resistance protein [Bacteroidales bacterium]MCM1068566.1 TerB family tellurite resistance protein [Prevotella sp.]MCM1353230.1 TerB family tellurite resistance protein [Bacteroides sp.]MCM1442362.1 TerB family tellurite resistance protein [Muribaculum sp.]MCM1481181.1 TerB family tellurite resistance protein [Paludibacter sp.]